MGTPSASSPESDATFYDAEEHMQASRRCATVARRRVSTDFPEAEPGKPVGPWRTVEVECQEASPWLLVGRRHSVDERRDALEQGKALFLRLLAARADGPWRASTAELADRIQALEEDVRARLEQQSRSLREAGAFWAERCRADRAYLERLEASAPALARGALPAGQARQAADWRRGVQRAAEGSEGWAGRLPGLIERHEGAAVEVRGAVARAVGAAEAAGGRLRAARGAVWPVASRPGGALPGAHSSDAGLEGPCLWQAVRKYLAACEGFQTAQCATLARLQRQKQRLVRLGEWVAGVLSAADGATPSSPSSLAEVPPEGDAEERLEVQYWERRLDAGADEGSDAEDEDGEAPLGAAVDISALVIHEQELEVSHGEEPGTGGWASARVLMSVDLWLHIWTPAELPCESEPTESLALPCACLRPVAARCEADARALRLALRPPPAPGPLARLGARLCAAPGRPRDGLLLRCADEAACEELLGALELVEKLYPTLG